MNEIKVSVIMSVFNTKIEYLSLAINSILNQSFKDFEFIIVDDYSTNGASDLIEQYRKLDNRIVAIKNDKNLGLTKSLNKCLLICKGKYVARMDSDDYSLPNRLEKQVKYLDRHENVVVVGSNGYTGIKKCRSITYWTKNDRYTKISMLFRNSGVSHPTAMFRRVVFSDAIYYDERIKKSQDFELWSRMCKMGKIKVLDDFLLIYRIHPEQISTGSNSEQCSFARQIVKRQINHYFDLPEEDLDTISRLFYDHDNVVNPSIIQRIFSNLIAQNNEKCVFDKNDFACFLGEMTFELKLKHSRKFILPVLRLKSFYLYLSFFVFPRLKYDYKSFVFKLFHSKETRGVFFEK